MQGCRNLHQPVSVHKMLLHVFTLPMVSHHPCPFLSNPLSPLSLHPSSPLPSPPSPPSPYTPSIPPPTPLPSLPLHPFHPSPYTPPLPPSPYTPPLPPPTPLPSLPLHPSPPSLPLGIRFTPRLWCPSNGNAATASFIQPVWLYTGEVGGVWGGGEGEEGEGRGRRKWECRWSQHHTGTRPQHLPPF